MSIPNYRVVLSFDAERKVFSARAPELEHCAAEGATRGEAISRLEKEIEAQLQNMQERGHRPPPSIDETVFTGEMQVKLSRTLHRDLSWQARLEGIDLDHLVSEILAAGLDSRKHGPRPQRGNRAPHAEMHDNAGNQREHSDRPRQGYGSRYHGILEDRANFIEYVRGLDSEGGRDPRGMQNGRGPRGGGPGGPGPRPGDRDDRAGGGPGDGRGHRRRRGGRGQGGQQKWSQGGPSGQGGQGDRDRGQQQGQAGAPQQAAPQSREPAREPADQNQGGGGPDTGGGSDQS